MKKLFLFLTLLLNAVWASAQFSGSGSGTEQDPYLIYNPVQLDQVRNFLGRTSGVYFKLMADLDLTEFIQDNNPKAGWLPIGSSSTPFNGCFDGNGKTISGLMINRPNTDCVGLFGCIGYNPGGSVPISVKDLTVRGDITGRNCVGSISGMLGTTKVAGSISGCAFYGNVTGNDYVGGLFGKSGYSSDDYKSNCSQCYVDVNIIGNSYVGGIAGYGRANTSGATVNISATGDYVYGIGEGTKNFVIGFIKSTGNHVYGTRGINSYFQGKVYGNEYVSGLYVGNFDLGYSYSNAIIKGSVRVAGISEDSRTCVAINRQLICEDNSKLWGRIGWGDIADEPQRSLNSTKVYVNGILQDVDDSRKNGIPTGQSLLKCAATYQGLGWNFVNVWSILETESYPYMQFQTAPPVIETTAVCGATIVSGKSVEGGKVYLKTNGKTYSADVKSNQWSITTDPLQAGDEVEVYAIADGKMRSYNAIQEVAYKGSGTENDPFQIYTAEDLALMNGEGYYKLMNDIDLSSYIDSKCPETGWEPIGKWKGIQARLDGNNKTIKGLWTNTSDHYTGLFSLSSEVNIKDLVVEIANGKKVQGGEYTGGIIGKYTSGTIQNCKVIGDVEGTSYVGGISGYEDSGNNINCTVKGNVTGKSNVVGGTLVKNNVGGIIGYTNSGIVKGDLFKGTVTSRATTGNAGGVIGYSISKVSECYSEGTVTAIGTTTNAGGIVGTNEKTGTLTDCYSIATVTSGYYGGGVLGYNYGSVKNCYSTGTVSAAYYAGGTVGYSDGADSNGSTCMAANNLLSVTVSTGWASRVFGGIKNSAPEPTNCIALKTMKVSINNVPQTIYDDPMNGTAKTQSELYMKTTYLSLGWDFTNVWSIDEGSGYPYLKNVGATVGGEEQGDDDPVNPDEPLPDNVIYADNTDVQPGGQMVLPVKMKSAEAITGYQFDLVLPDGFSVAEEDGDYLIDLASRTTYKKHSISYQDQADGSIRIVCTSLNNATFAELDGVVANITLNVDESVEAGDYNIIYKNIELATPALNKYKVAKWSSKVTVFDYILGDVNNDKDVSVVDAAATVNLILGVNTAGLNRKAADIDADGEISVTDAAGVVNIILGQGASVKSAPTKTRLTATADNTLALSDFTAEAGTQQTISVGMNNTASITGIQFDLVLPEGVTVAQEDGDYLIDISTDRTTYKNHSASYQMQADGSMRVVCTSLSNKTFKENSGNVIDITLDIASSISGGSHTITLKNIELATPELEKYKPSAVSATMTVSGGAYNYIAVDNGGNNVNKSVASGDDVTINDTYQSLSVTEDIDNVKVSYSRTYKNTSWQAWYVPFGFTLTSDIASRFSFAKFAGTYTEAGQFFITLVEMQEGDEIKGNVPYFVQAKVADSSNPQVLNISNTTLYATDASGFKMLSAEKEIAIYGTYAKKVAAADDDWYAYGGGKYIKATTGQSLGAFRFYLTIRDREDNPYASTPNPIEIKVVVLGDEADGISSLNGNDSENGTMFNLAGQPVGADYKGVVIRNGKKVLIK